MLTSKVADSGEPVGALHKRRITLADGRYLIFFTFGDEAQAADVTAQVAVQPEPVAAPVAAEERRV
jgi:hypothetical protein